MIGLAVFVLGTLLVGAYVTFMTKNKITVKNVLVKSVLCLLYVINGGLFITYAMLTHVIDLPTSIVEHLADTETQLEREIKSNES